LVILCWNIARGIFNIYILLDSAYLGSLILRRLLRYETSGIVPCLVVDYLVSLVTDYFRIKLMHRLLWWQFQSLLWATSRHAPNFKVPFLFTASLISTFIVIRLIYVPIWCSLLIKFLQEINVLWVNERIFTMRINRLWRIWDSMASTWDYDLGI
jgi:hypothetical protein